MPQVLEELCRHNVPIVLSTKSTLILRDIELIKNMDAHIAFTVTTMNETVAKLIEPGAPPPGERIAAAAEFVKRGIKTGVHMMPRITSYNVCYTKLLRRNAQRASCTRAGR